MLHRLRQFLALSPTERRWLGAACFYLPVHRFGIRVAGYRRWHDWLAQDQPSRFSGRPTALTDRGTAELTSQIATAIDQASRRIPGGANCLARSLTLWWFLRRRGLTTDLRIGIRKVETELEAHAWVELEGRALNDTEDVSQRYKAFDGPILPSALRIP